jgi:hypothetical protein
VGNPVQQGGGVGAIRTRVDLDQFRAKLFTFCFSVPPLAVTCSWHSGHLTTAIKPKVIASVDAVVIASPKDVQASQAESALRSGKHALVSSATFSYSYTFRLCLIYPYESHETFRPCRLDPCSGLETLA